MRKPTLRQSLAWLIVLFILMPVQSSSLVAEAASGMAAFSHPAVAPNPKDAGKHAAASVSGQPVILNSGGLSKPSLVGDEAWDIRFVNGVTTPGYSANVYAVAVMGSDVYVGGSFSMAGGIAADNIARWSTTSTNGIHSVAV